MKSFYVGTRIDHSEMNSLVGTSISRLNESLSKNLRSSVQKKGIKKTEQGKKLLFYNVDEEQYNQLISKGINVLVKVDSDELTTKLRDVNSRYPSRMDYSTSLKYKSELEKQFIDTIEVVGKDENIRSQRKQSSDYLGGNTKLGKLIYNTDGYSGYLGEVGDFFEYIFHKGYVVGFSYREDHSNLDLKTYEWKNSSELTQEVFNEYKNSYRLLTKWSRLGGYDMRIYLYESNGEFSMTNGYSYDGFSNDVLIKTSGHINELYKEFKSCNENEIRITNCIMDSYSLYGFCGHFFTDYEPVSWDECIDVYRNIFHPILKPENDEGFDTPQREMFRDLLLVIRGEDWMNLGFGLKIKKYYLKEEVSKEDIVKFWWYEEELRLLDLNPNITDEELMKEKEVYDEFSWSPNSRLEEIYESFNTPNEYKKVG